MMHDSYWAIILFGFIVIVGLALYQAQGQTVDKCYVHSPGLLWDGGTVRGHQQGFVPVSPGAGREHRPGLAAYRGRPGPAGHGRRDRGSLRGVDPVVDRAPP